MCGGGCDLISNVAWHGKDISSITVAAVVVTYNRRELLAECLAALLAQSVDVPVGVIVIDNASTDGTYDSIKQLIDDGRIRYVNTGSNLGGAGGFQRGVIEAVHGGYSHVWLMDDDCIPERDSLSNLLSSAQHIDQRYGFLCSKVLWRDRSISVMNVPRCDLVKNVSDFSSPLVKVDMASFVSILIPLSVVSELGLPIKEFFLWTDDWEYTRRISKKYDCYLVNDSVVVHKSKQNIGANVVNESVDRLDRFERLYRNDVYLYRREGLKGFFYEFVRIVVHTLRVLVFSKDHRMKRLKSIYVGTFRGLKFHPEIEFVRSNEIKK